VLACFWNQRLLLIKKVVPVLIKFPVVIFPMLGGRVFFFLRKTRSVIINGVWFTSLELYVASEVLALKIKTTTLLSKRETYIVNKKKPFPDYFKKHNE